MPTCSARFSGVTGTIAFIGGGGLTTACEPAERHLLQLSGGTNVVVMPTAAAFEHPDRLAQHAIDRFAAFGVSATAARVLNRRDANEAEAVERVAAAKFVYLLGSNPMHQRSALKDTAVWQALLAVLAAGGVVAAAGGAATGLCDPMVDPRGGGLGLGLGLVQNTAVVVASETVSGDHLRRTLDLAGPLNVLTIPTGAAALLTNSTWSAIGNVISHRGGTTNVLAAALLA
jgi:cyanophycinase